MYVKAGQYMINTENVTHMQIEGDGGMIVYFVGGQTVRLDPEDANVVYMSLNTAFATRPMSPDSPKPLS